MNNNHGIGCTLSVAESEFEKYRIVQDRLFESDFDKSIKALLEGKKGK